MEKIDFGLKKKGFLGIGLKGSLEDFSSDDLHTHPFHQVLQIKNGVALLQDNRLTKPQFGRLAAFIPADCPHRTKVLGDAVEYQSLYFNKSLLPGSRNTISIFPMSDLGVALLDHLNKSEPLQNINRGIAKECLMLFLKVLEQELSREVPIIKLRTPDTEMNKKICGFLEKHHHRKIAAQDLSIFPRSFRQLSRDFKSEMNVSIFEYLRLFRMLQAVIFLKTTDEKIVTIAGDCGYDSLSSFFSDFKKTFSISPREFRMIE